MEQSGHDHSYKLLFSHPEMIADLIRGYVREPWVERVDLTTLERVSGSYVTDDLRERQGDMIWRLRWADDERWVYVYLLLEFQTTSEPFMALRVLTYLSLLYEDLRRRNELTANGLLPPVLPIVLYRGSRRWSASANVASLIESVPGGLEVYRPQLRYLLLDERRYSNQRLGKAKNLVAALFALENSRDPSDVESVLDKLIEWLQTPDQIELRRNFTVWIKRVLLPTRVSGVHFKSLDDLHEVRSMLSERVEEWTKTWEEQGREKGRQQGLQEGRQEGEALLLMHLIEMKFGADVLETYRERVELAQADQLLGWSERILTAGSVEEMFDPAI